MKFAFLVAVLSQLFVGGALQAEDGYRLWLRYDALPRQAMGEYQRHIASLIVPGDSDTQVATRRELVAGCSGLLGHPVPVTNDVNRDGAVIAGTPQSVPAIAGLKLDKELAKLGREGFLIRSLEIGGHRATVIASSSDVGALYGAFHFLRLVQELLPIDKLNISDKPRLDLRLLNHWDNVNGSIERGYAGASIFWSADEPQARMNQRLTDYARADASIGINGAVLNNVNAQAESLDAEHLKETAAIAAVLRPYGVRVYLTARFDAPIGLGHLKTADPLNPEVIAWWQAKVDEIYKLIPDFGGFLVKANSEGQPGPVSYHRTHADGSNMFAAVLAPHGGIVMWRAFVYGSNLGPDRIAHAYGAFKPLDGQFASNVLVQVKNGPLDFQPREPFSPLFGAMPKTQLLPELQITQEYLGHAHALAFLAPMWKEFLDSDTYAKGSGSTVTKVMDGSLYGQRLTGVAGVANTGLDRNWCGSDFAQANWYAFGRLAWNPDLASRQIAEEWVHMTFTHDPRAVETISRAMLESREAAVDYMTPLGLTHQMGDGHYAPAPWNWRSLSHADTEGIGFDRTSSGSAAASQYQGGTRERFETLSQTPDQFLLWFHHVPWDYKMRSGRTLWEELCLHYQHGTDWVKGARKEWDSLDGAVDPDRHAAVAAMLALQERDAEWWRDACLLYFQSLSNRPFPDGVEKPPSTLEQIKTVRYPW